MPYFQLRITFSQTRTMHVVLRSISFLIREYNLDTYSCGHEKLNKYGEPCDPHVHFNFLHDIDRVNPKRCIQDKLRRHYELQDISLKGNKQWSLQMVEEPTDFYRWLRYPLKENPVPHLCKNVDTECEGNDFKQLAKDAQNERATSIEINLLRREKLRNKDQFKNQMYDYIKSFDQDELNPLLQQYQYKTNHMKVWKLIYKFYQLREKPINWTTIEGYTNLFLADSGCISEDTAFNLAHDYNV